MTGYRAEVRSCASCSRPMSVHHVAHQGEQIEVDQCESCGSFFLDYWDGEPGAVARSIEEAGRFKPKVAASAKNCPACRVPLELTPYLEESGPVIYRCGGCGGAFLLPVQLGAIADYRGTPKAMRSKLAMLMARVMDLFVKDEG